MRTTKLSLTAILIFLIAFFISLSMFGQEPVKAPAKITVSWKVKIPDTCKIYIGARGGKFVFLKSKKTNKVYKYYLPKNK
jgi:hypothetical protein